MTSMLSTSLLRALAGDARSPRGSVGRVASHSSVARTVSSTDRKIQSGGHGFAIAEGKEARVDRIGFGNPQRHLAPPFHLLLGQELLAHPCKASIAAADGLARVEQRSIGSGCAGPSAL